MNKKNVIVLFGGCSPEHEVSKASAATVISYMTEDKYNIIPVYITKEGKWLMYDGSIDNIRNLQWERLGTQAHISPDRVSKGLMRIVGDKARLIPVDIVFSVLHGPNGEDGTVQGLLELSGLPYVGCGVLASAISMDKEYTKLIAQSLNIAQAPYVVIREGEPEEERRRALIRIGKMKYPVFVKPARAGSSVGVSKVLNRKELDAALMTAFEFDNKIIVEKAIDGKELECAVLGTGGDDTKASGVGEILTDAEFYDYDAKYVSSESKTVVPADIPEEAAEKIREISVKIFKGVSGFGLARVDFFLIEDKVIFNEINTMPGFTSISMYPKLWKEAGIDGTELVDTLIELAEKRG